MPCLDNDSFFIYPPASRLPVCPPRRSQNDLSHLHWVSLPELKPFVAYGIKPTYVQDLHSLPDPIHRCHLMPLSAVFEPQGSLAIFGCTSTMPSSFLPQDLCTGLLPKFPDSSHSHLPLTSGLIHYYLFR